jgi:SAM-dependent methyltransferase
MSFADPCCVEDIEDIELINHFKKQIVPVLDGIVEDAVKKKVKDFWDNSVVRYFVKLESIDQAIRKGFIEPSAISSDVISMTNETLEEGDRLETFLNNPDLIKKIKDTFRISGAPYGLQSDFVRHALEKPGGYPGDYELLEFIYNNTPSSKGLGYCADETFLLNDYAKAVRNRKDKMKKILLPFLKADPDALDVLNIACGSSRDLREMFLENDLFFSGNISFTLIDKSAEALEYSREKLSDVPESVEFTFYNHSVYDYLKDPAKYIQLLGSKDIVYSIGLADYIPEEGFRDLISFLFKLLKPGGRLIIAHKDSKNYHPLTPDWWADWSFHLRDIDDVVSIAKSSAIENYDLTIDQEDDTNIIFFMTITKKHNA